MSTAVQFQWTAGQDVSQYSLDVGTTAGGSDIYGQSQGTASSTTVEGLPTDGSTVYVRLGSLIAGAWRYNDYTYSACSSCGARGSGSPGVE